MTKSFQSLIIFSSSLQIGFLAYCYVHSDTNRLEYGYDDCGNVCGILNTPDDRLACKGADKTNEKYLVTENDNRRCVKSCEDERFYTPSAGYYCLTEKEKREITAGDVAEFTRSFTGDIKECMWRILITMAFACGFSALVLLLFRHFIKYIVWTILLVVTVCLIAVCALAWVDFAKAKEHSPTDGQYRPKRSIVEAIIVTVLAVAFPLCVFIFRREIRFTIRLLKEAGKAIIDMSLLMLVPFGVSLKSDDVHRIFRYLNILLFTSRPQSL
jgi:Plasma-membrane choline transporter